MGYSPPLDWESWAKGPNVAGAGGKEVEGEGESESEGEGAVGNRMVDSRSELVLVVSLVRVIR